MANRIAYDSDGSIAAWWDASESYVALDQAGAEALNGASSAGLVLPSVTDTWYASIAFPEARDLQGYFASAALYGNTSGRQGNLGLVETSVDTTTGLDGTWVSQGAVQNPNGLYGNVAAWPSFTVLSVNGIKGIRISYIAATSAGYDHTLDLFHVYATNTSPSGRLALWHPTLDEAIDADDIAWGVAPRSSTAVQQFRIKNTHASETAQSIDLSTTIITDSTPSLPPQLEFSSDGTNFSATLNIGNLAAGATSSVLYYRRSIAANAQLGYWMPRIVAQAGTWV